MKALGFFLGLVAIAALAFFGYQKYGDWQDARRAQWRVDSARVADTTRAATIAAAKKDTVYLRARASYVAHRDRVLSSGTATPRDTATFGKCDELQLTCDERHAADEKEKASLRDELRVARARPTERPKRVTLFGEGLYDLLSAAPVLGAGAEFRILGEIRVKAAGDVSIPSATECASGRCGVKTRALVGIRYVF